MTDPNRYTDLYRTLLAAGGPSAEAARMFAAAVDSILSGEDPELPVHHLEMGLVPDADAFVEVWECEVTADWYLGDGEWCGNSHRELLAAESDVEAVTTYATRRQTTR